MFSRREKNVCTPETVGLVTECYIWERWGSLTVRWGASPVGKGSEGTKYVLVSFDESGLAAGRSRIMVLASKSLSPLPSVNWKSISSPSQACEPAHRQNMNFSASRH